MKNAFGTELRRTVRHSMGRFVAILLIVALGAGFYAGLRATAPDMRMTMDRYMDEYRMMDLRVVSTMGLTDADVAAVRDVAGVDGVMPAHFLDAMIEVNGTDSVVRVHSLPGNTSDNDKNYLNRVKLAEGRMPQADNECLMTAGKLKNGGTFLGEQITLQSVADGKLKNTEYTVVGLIDSAYYISFQMGSTDIGSGTLSFFMYIPESNFQEDYYTELFVSVAGAAEENTFTDAYDAVVGKVQKRLEKIANGRLDVRRAELSGDAEAQLAQARRDYESGKAESDKALADAEQQLTDGAAELETRRQQWTDAQTQIADGKTKIAESRQQIADGWAAYRDGTAQLAQARAEYEAGVLAYNQAKAQADNALDNAQAQLTAGKIQLTLKQAALKEVQKLQADAAANVQTKESELAELRALEAAETDPAAKKLYQAQITLKEQELNTAQKTLTAVQEKQQTLQTETAELAQTIAAGEAELVAQRGQINAQLMLTEQKLQTAYSTITANEQKLADSKTQLESGETELAEQSAKLTASEAELADGKAQLDDAEAELADGRAQLEAQRAEVAQQLADAEQKIKDGEAQLESLKNAVWYVLDRHTNVGFASFEGDCGRMDALSKVFPMIFFAVAILVALTTMTRMVEEERSLIGTYRALGYSKRKILSKYLIYAGSATIGGCVPGILVLQKALPIIIWNCYRILYTGPGAYAPYNLKFALVGTAASLILVLGAAFLVCRSSVAECPAQLLQPKAPKAGKRILLERIPLIWNRLNFIQKVTARNIFRYKKRLIMTVVGIAGCTGLLLTGFGIKDSVSSLLPNQYEDLYQYDVQLTTDQAALSDETQRLLDDSPEIASVLRLYQTAQDLTGNGHTMSASIVVPEDTEKFPDFVRLRTRVGHKPVEFGADSVIVTEKLASRLGLHIGDDVTIQKPDGTPATLTITGITENYLMHYIYIAPELYRAKIGDPAVFNEIQLICDPDMEVDTDALCKTLSAQADIRTATSVRAYSGQFESMISSLNYVVLVIIVCAGLLAFVVLYNLTNINISERQREIATIKVLGFYKMETAMYIYRETILLTLLGCLFGLGFGVILHIFVIQTVEVDLVMFGRTIAPLSYGIAAALTFVFSFLVNVVMYRKLTGISMVESLKSVD